MNEKQINYLLVLATLLVVWCYTNTILDVAVKAGFIGHRPALNDRMSRPLAEHPNFHQPYQGVSTKQLRTPASWDSKQPLPAEVQKFLEKRRAAAAVTSPASAVKVGADQVLPQAVAKTDAKK